MPKLKAPVDLEKVVASHVAKYLQTQYPDVIYRFDLAADIRLTMGQAKRNKELHPFKGHPDLWISEARLGFHGMYLEIKKADKSPYLKDGSLSKAEHIQTQNAYHKRLRAKGYYVSFSVGFEETKQKIDDYLRKN